MTRLYLKKTPAFLFACLLLMAASCSTIAKFDQYSYAQATSLKVDAMNVMSSATDSFKLHTTEVTQLRTNLSKIYEYEKNKPKNIVTTKMWSVLIDSTGGSLGGFLTRWQKKNILDTAFINQSKILIGESFDQISALESGKIKGAN